MSTDRSGPAAPLKANTAKAAELQVMIWFLEGGWEVFAPTHDQNATDLVVRPPGARAMLAVQVKHKQTGSKNEGQLQNKWNDGNAPFDLLVFYQPSKSRGVMLPRETLKKKGKNLFFFARNKEGYNTGRVRPLFADFAFDFSGVGHEARAGAFVGQVERLMERTLTHVPTCLYFAYGSNMLTERLRQRVPGARPVGVGQVSGRRLAFQKASKDLSSKCDIPMSANPTDVAHGVLFNIPISEMRALDKAEGLGSGYEVHMVEVTVSGGAKLEATTYVASVSGIDPKLVPYDWYKNLVVAGAQQHSLPEAYQATIAAVASKPDPDLKRESRLEALEVLTAWQAQAGPK